MGCYIDRGIVHSLIIINVLKANAYLFTHSLPLDKEVRNPVCLDCRDNSPKADSTSIPTDGPCGRYAKIATGIKQSIIRKMMIFYF